MALATAASARWNAWRDSSASAAVWYSFITSATSVAETMRLSRIIPNVAAMATPVSSFSRPTHPFCGAIVVAPSPVSRVTGSSRPRPS